MLPLKNKTVVITRSKEQASDFIIQLEKLGAKTIALPLIENTTINQPQLIKKLSQHNYSWIIFTSPNAVSFFFRSVKPETITSKIAVVGSKTGDLIEKLGLIVAFIPTNFTAECLAKEIPVTENDSILIPRSNLAKDDIIEVLERRKSVVETLSIYKNTAVNYSKSELEKIFNQNIDFITFTSGSTVTSFMKLGIKIDSENTVCIGPETTKVAEKNGLTVKAIADPHTIEGMVDKIIVITRGEAIS